jgi:hypothetical protein
MKQLLIFMGILLVLQTQVLAQGKGDKKSRDDTFNRGEEVFVCTTRSVIFDGTSRAANPILEVKEGQKLRILEDKVGPRGLWTKVGYAEKVGYISRSALVKREFFIPSESAEQTEDVRKMQRVGAAKGFNPQVEKKYSETENLGAQFALLDTEIIPKPEYKANLVLLARRINSFKEEGGMNK